GMSSLAYHQFLPPIDSARNGFDFHVYYAPADVPHAQSLHSRISLEFPEASKMHSYSGIAQSVCCQPSLSSAPLIHIPAGPHPTPMFEVNTFTPHQTGALFCWLVVNRGPCSVLIHPNTDDELADHTTLATWMGTPWPLKTD
ncbi:DOPA-like domain-containing protein, partial [Mycena leptocephala]